MGQAGNSACAMDIIWDELERNNIEIDKEMLSFHIHACLREHEKISGAIINEIHKDNLSTNLCDIYEEMSPNIFGRLMAYLIPSPSAGRGPKAKGEGANINRCHGLNAPPV